MDTNKLKEEHFHSMVSEWMNNTSVGNKDLLSLDEWIAEKRNVISRDELQEAERLLHIFLNGFE